MDKIEFAEIFKKRTKQLAIDTIIFSESIQKNESARIICRQLIRSSTSGAANYRAACRERSQAEIFSKLSIVVEQGDEFFWLELIEESNIFTYDKEKHTSLTKEMTEIVKVMARARKNSKKK